MRMEESLKLIGIYKIENRENGKLYIGQAKDIRDRWRHHVAALRNEYHSNKHLQYSWNKYGKESFIFSIIEICSIEELNDKEIFWIKECKSADSRYGYNIALGGESPTKGRKHSEETKRKISQARIGKYCGENSPMFGKKLSQEARNKISAAAIERYKTHPHPKSMLGKKMSDESKAKMSASHISKKTARNTSGYIGVNFDKLRNKWLVRININGRPKNIGRFDNIFDAARKYDSESWKLFHDLGKLNFPEEFEEQLRDAM